MTSPDPRDLEWQRRYQENDTPWDKGAPAPPLALYLVSNSIAGRVLVPGCGRGHDVRALAAQPNCVAVGLDISPIAIAEATRLAAETNLSAGTSFVLGDFFRLPHEMLNAFNWLVEHTCFCAIDPSLRDDYVRSAAAVLRPGGKIFGIFFLTPDVEAGPPFGISREELLGHFAPHFQLIHHWAPTMSYPGRENRELVLLMQKR